LEDKNMKINITEQFMGKCAEFTYLAVESSGQFM
jgi:hypothetical protein